MSANPEPELPFDRGKLDKIEKRLLKNRVDKLEERE
jgi:hypothetical protein